MFVDITLENFRSVKEAQTLSFESITDRRLRTDHVIDVDDRTSLLKYCSIAGPNGVGKSTVVRALEMLQGMVLATEEDNNPLLRLSGASFAYDSICKRSPSSIQIQIIRGEDEETGLPIYYTYSLRADNKRVYNESLYQRIGRASSKLFERELITSEDSEEESYYVFSYGKKYIGVKKRFSNKLPENKLFLGNAARAESASLMPIFEWFRDDCVIIPIGLSPMSEDFILKAMKRYPSLKGCMLEFLHNMDFIDIKDFNIVEKEGAKDRLVYIHGVNRSRYASYFSSESLGTRRITMMAVVIWQAMQKNMFLVADDFGLLLHDTILNELFEKFSYETRLSKSQMLTTGVDLTPLKKGQHRFDEIWLTSKDSEGSTRYYSLADFVMRKNDSVKDMYLNGAYGSVPILSECVHRRMREEK